MSLLVSSGVRCFARRGNALMCTQSGNVNDRIKSYLSKDDVVLFMKGDPVQPMCGFSQLASKVLQVYEVKFKTYDVLQDAELREGVKKFSDWPTIPQLYVKQEFIGGSDIIKQMYMDGSLEKLFADNKINHVPVKS